MFFHGFSLLQCCLLSWLQCPGWSLSRRCLGGSSQVLAAPGQGPQCWLVYCNLCDPLLCLLPSWLCSAFAPRPPPHRQAFCALQVPCALHTPPPPFCQQTSLPWALIPSSRAQLRSCPENLLNSLDVGCMQRCLCSTPP